MKSANSSNNLKLPKRAVTVDEFKKLSKAASDAVQQHRAAAQIAAESLAQGRSAFTDSDGTRDERLARTRFSALEFGKIYLPHYFEQEGAPFHDALDKLITGNYSETDLRRWADEFGIEAHSGDVLLNLLAICLFRGSGKSTLAILCDVLRRICHGLDPYIVIGSDTVDQAASQLEDIKDELASNEKIKADFGSLKPSADGVWQTAELQLSAKNRVMWREGRIITTNSIRVDAIGRGSKLRGRRHGQKRPTYIVLDDLDNDENVVTVEQRNKAWNWVVSAVEPARDPQIGRMVIIGTVIHFDCIIARAVRKTDSEGNRQFSSIKFAAMFKSGDGNWKSNWEKRFPVKILLSKAELLGWVKFGAEYMNNPRDPDAQVFKPDEFRYYREDELSFRKLVRVLYVDPSKGKRAKGRKKSDFSGFAEILADTTERISYVRDAFRKRLSPSAAKTEIVRWVKKALVHGGHVELWIEENAFGDILGETFQTELRRSGIDLKVNTFLHTAEKEARLLNHSIRVDTGGVQFPAKWENDARRPEFFAEYEDFPSGAFDDTIDAIESADHIAMNALRGEIQFQSLGRTFASAKLKSY